MSGRYFDKRQTNFEHARNHEFPDSIVVRLGEKKASTDNITELAEVHKLFNLAGLTPLKSEKALSAEELAVKFQNIPNLVAQARNKELVVTVGSNGKNFVYIGLPGDFYAKYFKYEKLKKGYLQSIDKKENNGQQ